MPWVIVGDFNEPLSSADKLGGRDVSIRRSLLLKDCLDRCNMIDLGFSGSRFTWANRRDAHILIQERIDRFFVNSSWCTLYPEAKVSHLTRCHSDHCRFFWKPVLLCGLSLMCLLSSRASGFQTLPFLGLSSKLGVKVLTSRVPFLNFLGMLQNGIKSILVISLQKREGLWLG